MSRAQENTGWTFLTNHAQVLLHLAQDTSARLRDVAVAVGITERAAQRIVADLVDGNFLERRRVGRRNHYSINPNVAMRHSAQQGQPVATLLNLLQPDAGDQVEGTAQPLG